MKKRTGFILVIVVALTFLNLGSSFAQEEVEKEEVSVPAVAGPEGLWVWGEVVSVDAANKSCTIKYLDYETDQEKEMLIATDTDTVYENANSVDDIKPQDTVSIDYIVTLEGKNLAKNISVEKPEAQETDVLKKEPLEENTEAAVEVIE